MLLVADQKLGGEYCQAGPRPIPLPSIASCSFWRSIDMFTARRTSTLLNGGMVLEVVTIPSLRVLRTLEVTFELPRRAARFLTGRLISSARSTCPAATAFSIAVVSVMTL